MGKLKPLAISYANEGLVKNKNAFVLADDAFQTLENAYVWRGRIKRRQGNTLLGRLAVQEISLASLLPVSQAIPSFNILTGTGINSEHPNATIRPGTATQPFTILLDSDTLTDTTGTGTFTISPGLDATAATINYSTGVVTITTTGTWSAFPEFTGYYYPNRPVMGLINREQELVNLEQLWAFDDRYSYTYNSSIKEFLRETTSAWSGNDTNYFNGVNYYRDSTDNRLFWVSNFRPEDPIRYYDGSVWNDFQPALDAGGTSLLLQARLLIPNRGRMLAFNTYEGGSRNGTHYPNRARWSQIGSPIDASGEAWRSEIIGRGGFLDCPVQEAITDWEYVQDQLIIIFERSTWRFRYTGSELQPYAWERISRERGGQPLTAQVFDKGIVYIGDKSINYCSGTNVESVSEEIPDEVFSIKTINDGNLKIKGIRDYKERLVYWSYPYGPLGKKFSNRVLVFNYDNESYAIFKDSITCFGTYQDAGNTTWAELEGTNWRDAHFSWVAGRNIAGFPQIVAGNQQGFVQKFGTAQGDGPSLCIKSITAGSQAEIEVINHNLEDDDWILIEGVIGVTGSNYYDLNGKMFQVSVIDGDTLQLFAPPEATITAIDNEAGATVTAAQSFDTRDVVIFRGVTGLNYVSGTSGINQQTAEVIANTFSNFTVDFDTSELTSYTSGGFAVNISKPANYVALASQTYIGGGLVSKVPNFKVRSKKFNILLEGRKQFLSHIDFLAQTSVNGGFQCDIYTDYSDEEAVNDGEDTFFNRTVSTVSSNIGNFQKQKDWFRFYCPTDAQFFDFELKFSAEQIQNPDSSIRPELVIDAFILYTEGAGRLAE